MRTHKHWQSWRKAKKSRQNRIMHVWLKVQVHMHGGERSEDKIICTATRSNYFRHVPPPVHSEPTSVSFIFFNPINRIWFDLQMEQNQRSRVPLFAARHIDTWPPNGGDRFEWMNDVARSAFIFIANRNSLCKFMYL